jgi:hypothetical protein
MYLKGKNYLMAPKSLTMKNVVFNCFLLLIFCLFQNTASTQNIGIGTPTPAIGKLQVNGNRDILPLVAMLDSSSFGTGSIRFVNLARTAYPITIAGLSLGSSNAQSSLTIFSPSNNIAHFAGDGKVGINTNSPQTTLDVNGNTRTNGLEVNGVTNSDGLQINGSNVLEMGVGVTKQADAGKVCYGCFGEANRLHLVGGGTNGGGTDRIIKLWSEGSLVVRGNTMPDATSTYTIGRAFNVWRSSWTDSAWSNSFMFRNASAFLKGNAAEVIVAQGAAGTDLLYLGNQGVVPATDNLYYLGTPSKRFVAVYAATGTIQTSDANLKTNIVHSPYGLEEVMKMNPVQFNWKEQPAGDKEIGFLAQDIEKIIPEAVVKNGSNSPLGMKYSELIPVLVKAIQEQQQKIEALEKKLASRQ